MVPDFAKVTTYKFSEQVFPSAIAKERSLMSRTVYFQFYSLLFIVVEIETPLLFINLNIIINDLKLVAHEAIWMHLVFALILFVFFIRMRAFKKKVG